MRKLWILAIGLVAVVSACSTSTPAAPASAPPLDGTSWTVTQIKGAAVVPGHEPTMEFAGGKVAGSASCNRYNAAFTQNGTQLTISPGAMTQMMCQPEAIATQEQAFTAALGTVAGVRGAGDGLELLDASGQVVLTLTKLLDAPLEKTEWQLSGIISKQAVSSPVGGSAVTMTIADGQLSGKACNTFRGMVVVDGGSFKAGPLMSTKMACANADETAQETTVLRTLEAADAFLIKGSQLTITAPDGTGLEFTAK